MVGSLHPALHAEQKVDGSWPHSTVVASTDGRIEADSVGQHSCVMHGGQQGQSPLPLPALPTGGNGGIEARGRRAEVLAQVVY